jgi:hypothetical protein
MTNFNHTNRRKAAYRKGYEAGKAEALATQPSVAVKVLQDAAKEVIASAADTYKKRNGHTGSFEDETGEKCWIVPFDAFEALRSASSAQVQDMAPLLDDTWNAAVEHAATIADDCVHLRPDPGAAIRTILNGRAKLHPDTPAMQEVGE